MGARNFQKGVSLATLFFIITTLVLAVLLWVNYSRKPKDTGYDNTTVLTKIVHLQELALVRYNYAGVIGFKEHYQIMNINVPLTGKYFLLKYNGYIKAGVDFERIKVSVDDKRVHVSMPSAKLLDVVIDEQSVKVYDESENAFNQIKISDYNQTLIKEKNTMQKDAVNQGILKDADKQAKLAITSMLQEMGFTEIIITDEIHIFPPN